MQPPVTFRESMPSVGSGDDRIGCAARNADARHGESVPRGPVRNGALLQKHIDPVFF